METIQIKGTDLNVSRIGLGTWAIGGWLWGGTDEGKALLTIESALDHGINFIDTAPVYGQGVSEELVGKAVERSGKRNRFVLATKTGLEWTENGASVFRNSTRERILKEAEDSLRRLRTDVIDLYQVHWPDDRVPFEETAEAMSRLYRDGKIRAVGVSNFSPSQMESFRKAAPLHTAQPPYNLFERGIESDVLPDCQEKGVATVMYGALCRGLLSGRMAKDTTFPGDDLRSWDPKFQAPRFEMYLEAVEKLDRFALERFGKRVIHLAVRWMLDRPGVSVALWGARNPVQLGPVDELWGWKLDSKAMREVDDIIETSVTDPVGPEFMAPPHRE